MVQNSYGMLLCFVIMLSIIIKIFELRLVLLYMYAFNILNKVSYLEILKILLIDLLMSTILCEKFSDFCLKIFLLYNHFCTLHLTLAFADQ